MFPAAEALGARARARSPSARVILYVTPAWRDGNPAAASVSPEMSTYDGMQRRLIRSYEVLAARMNASLAPVGNVWRSVRAANPSLALYDDETHPNAQGAYLIACVIYTTVTGRSAVANTFTANIDSETARWLQEMATQMGR